MSVADGKSRHAARRNLLSHRSGHAYRSDRHALGPSEDAMAHGPTRVIPLGRGESLFIFTALQYPRRRRFRRAMQRTGAGIPAYQSAPRINRLIAGASDARPLGAAIRIWFFAWLRPPSRGKSRGAVSLGLQPHQAVIANRRPRFTRQVTSARGPEKRASSGICCTAPSPRWYQRWRRGGRLGEDGLVC